jgi:hypothetical protein
MAQSEGTDNQSTVLYKLPLFLDEDHYRNVLTPIFFGPERMPDCDFGSVRCAVRLRAQFSGYAFLMLVNVAAPRFENN